MRKIIKHIAIPLIFLIIINASACNVNNENSDAINSWIDLKIQAIEACDVDAYMKSVNQENYYLYNEEFNLISSLDKDKMSSISIEASQIQNNDSTAVYRIDQKYEYDGKKYSCSYPAQFIWDNGALRYNGIVSEMLDAETATVYYPEGYKGNAQKYAHAVEYYLEKLNSVYSFAPSPKICIKIYDDHDVFLQSVKYDLPKWVGGWHEYGESVKIFIPNKNTAVNPSMLYHECSHRFLSEITNDNASYWLQEGFATLMETSIPTGLANIAFLYNNDIENLKFSNSLWSFSELVDINLEELSEPVQVKGYYALSALCTKHIIDLTGMDSFLGEISRLKDNPQILLTASEKIDTTNDLTIGCLSELLGLSKTEFYSAMDEFIDDYR